MSKNKQGNGGAIVAIAVAIGIIGLIVWAIAASGNKEEPSKSAGAKSPATITDTKFAEIKAEDQIRGSKDAPITFIEYSDFQCPYCVRLHPVMEKVIDKYSDKAKWVYRHFPLNFHNNAKKAAEAAEAAGEQGKFWEFSSEVAKNSQQDGTGLNTADLEKYAVELGLDMVKFNDAVTSGKYRQKVEADYNSGVAAGVEGTPSLFMIGKDGKVEKVQSLDEAALIAKIEAASKE